MQAFGANSAAFSSNVVVYQDWLISSTLRTHGIMANATWAGGFSALSLMLLIATQEKKIHSIFRNLYKYFLLIHVIFLSLSRSVLLSLFLSALIGMLLKASNELIPEIRIAFKQIIVITIVTLAVITFNNGQLSQTVKSINQSRSGSLETRSDIYRVTAQLVKDHPFPAIGYGIKPSGEGLVASIATHSTPLGILFKGGLFGLVAYISFLILGLKKLVTTKNYLGLVMLNFIIMWSMLEDFDGGHLIPLFLGLVFQPKLIQILRNQVS
jgi:O-antigen ligase